MLQGVFNCRACGTDTTVCTECACGYKLVRVQIVRDLLCWVRGSSLLGCTLFWSCSFAGDSA